MITIFSHVDVKTCSREECESMLLHLRSLLLLGGEEKLRMDEQIILFQRRLTRFRIDNIKMMVKGLQAPS